MLEQEIKVLEQALNAANKAGVWFTRFSINSSIFI